MSDDVDQAVQPAEWVPEFEGQRPPFQPGNVPANAFEPGNVPANTSHGAYSPRKVDPLAQDILDVLLADDTVPTYVKAPAYRLELISLARAEAKVQLIEEWLTDQASEKHPMGDLGDDRVQAAYLQLHRASTRAASSRTRLGLTPASATRMGKNLAQGQAAAAQGDLALRMAASHAAEERLRAAGWRPPAPRPADDGREGGTDGAE